MDDIELAVGPLTEIRKDTLLLSIAKEYLYEDLFLVKIGKDIEHNTGRLKDDINALKKKFPGKFAVEVDTDSILGKIKAAALTLIDPKADIKENFRSGELGRRLESDVKSISDAVNIIRVQVLGKRVSYTREEAVLNQFTRLKDIGSSFANTLFLVSKILFCIIIIAAVAFGYLYYTMEKEESVLKEITEIQTLISERQSSLSQIEVRKEEISEEIKALEKKGMARSEKIAIMDLENEMQNLNQDRDNYQTEITAHEKEIAEKIEMIEEIKRTTFIKRLLRQ
ncbi:MAG TPA: hypothetical protein VJ373_02890 [Desulfatiglandales bacterium]|nr:hypothetical protein [Desulfatiglandales bacterium]